MMNRNENNYIFFRKGKPRDTITTKCLWDISLSLWAMRNKETTEILVMQVFFN